MIDPALPFTAVAFDLDGTLIDSVRDIADAVNEVLAALGRPPHPMHEVRTMVGHGAAVLLQRALGSPDPELLARARSLFQAAYGARLTRTTRLFEGLREVLVELAARGIELSIATNKPASFTEPLVSALDLHGAGIHGVASSDETAAKKPDPAVVVLALERAHARAGGAPSPHRRVAYVGDMPIDVETARRLPCTAVGVSWGFDPEGLRRARPDRWADTPAELLAVLTH